MATKTETILIDDLTGEVGATTLLFGLDGVNYEIDLSESSMATVREALTPLAEAARKVGGKTPRKSSGSKPSSSNASKIREWAKENGYTVGDRGRIPAEVTEAYTAANQG